jgi:hypothetical protein
MGSAPFYGEIQLPIPWLASLFGFDLHQGLRAEHGITRVIRKSAMIGGSDRNEWRVVPTRLQLMRCQIVGDLGSPLGQSGFSECPHGSVVPDMAAANRVRNPGIRQINLDICILPEFH